MEYLIYTRHKPVAYIESRYNIYYKTYGSRWYGSTVEDFMNKILKRLNYSKHCQICFKDKFYCVYDAEKYSKKDVLEKIKEVI